MPATPAPEAKAERLEQVPVQPRLQSETCLSECVLTTPTPPPELGRLGPLDLPALVSPSAGISDM